jgi:2-phosphosulfolactate phosphatase
VRLEWGPTGARAVLEEAATAVVVDVLSFTTAVTIAVERGASVLPYRWRDDSAVAYARARDAVLAQGRREALESGAPSLSPAGLVALSGVERLVLPSPNGSTIAHALAGSGATVVAACLRNASVVAEWLAPRAADGVAVIAAGERWPDGSLRPAAEDLWGAGAVLSGMVARGVTALSPEARLAATAYDAVAGDVVAELQACASGVELVEGGFAEDVRLAAELDASPILPVLTPDGFSRGRPLGVS